MKTKSKRLALRAAASIAALTTLTSAVSCTKPGAKEQKKTIAVIGKSQVSFWDDFRKGAEDAGNELGYDIDYVDPNDDNDVDKQLDYLKKAVSKNISAVVIAPNSPNELNAELASLKEKDIPIIEVNSVTDGFADYDSLIGSSNFDAGKVAGRKTAEAIIEKYESISQKAKIAIIGHSAAAAEDRINGFKSELITRINNELSNYSLKSENSLSIADKTNIQDDGMTASEKRQNILKTYFVETEKRFVDERDAYEQAFTLIQDDKSDITVIFATNTNTTIGVCKAVVDANKQDKIIVVGFNTDKEELQYIENGVLTGTILQNPYIMGYLGVRYANNSLSGKRPPAYVDTGVTYIDSASLHNNEYVKLITSLSDNNSEE